ncbi:probable protein phosphatase 2C 51, partial [Tanacetum coccineum]
MVSLSQPQMLLLLVLATVLHTINGLPETYSSCMTAYNSGGAPAVLDSTPDCASHFMVDFFKKSTHDCEFATLQGYRKYQEDRVSCNLHLRLPLF